MQLFSGKIKGPTVISTTVTGCFILLEVINRGAYKEPFPFMIFATLWILMFTFFVTLVRVVQDTRRDDRGNTNNNLIRVFLMIMIAWMWLAIVQDQMPCFLGAPYCD